MSVRRIGAHEGRRLRALRLQALADAPTAFGSTFAEEQARPTAFWERLAERAAGSDVRAIFVWDEDGRWYGLVGGIIEPDRPQTVDLISMWVDPRRRGSGIGRALVDAVVAWAHGRGAARVELWVTETNEHASALYLRSRFVATERTQPHPSQPELRERLMVRTLG